MRTQVPPEMLGPVDTAFLHVESDASPMNIGAVSIFRGHLDFDALMRHVDSRLYMAPLYQKRLIETPLNLGGPAWHFDPDFHLGNHIFQHELESPGTEGQLRELAGRLISRRLDRSKPLWEMYVIYGLNQIGDQSGEFTSILFKVHHAMVDGLSAIELITLLFDLTPDVYPTKEKPIYDPPDLPSTIDMIADSVRSEITHKLGVISKLGSDLSFLGLTLSDREKRRRMFRGIANLINDNLKPITPLSINGKNTGNITVAWADFSLAEVRAIRTQRRCTINDVMVSVLAGAIERHERDQRGQRSKATFLRVLVPVNMRVENEKSDFGNRISVLPLDAPFGMDDPLARLEAIGDYSSVMKNSFLANTLDMVLTMPALALAPTQPLIWAAAPIAFAFLAHTWCTNVSGPQIPIYLLGHEMVRSFGFFPLNPSMGLACVVMSYNQRITMTLIADAGIVPDVVRIKSHLESSFAELRRAANVEPVQPLVLERVKAESAPAPVTARVEAAAPVEVKADAPAPVAAKVEAAAPVEVKADAPAPVAAKVEAAAPVEAKADAPAPVAAKVDDPAPVEVKADAPAPVAAKIEAAAPVEVKADAPAPVTAKVEAAAPVEADAPAPVAAKIEAAAPVEAKVDAPAPVTAKVEAAAPVEAKADAPAPVAARVEDAAPVVEDDAQTEPAPLPIEAQTPEPALIAASPLAGDGTAAAVALAAAPAAVADRPVEAAPQPDPVVETPPLPAAPSPTPSTPPLAYPEAHVNGRRSVRLFSEPWAQAFMVAINDSSAYRAASLKWTAGALAFIMKAAPAHGFIDDTAVVMDLYRGQCRSAHNRSRQEAQRDAAFVIEGDYRTWMRVLSGASPPLTMLMRGELHLRKGSLIKLIPFTQSAQELLKCAQHVPFETEG